MARRPGVEQRQKRDLLPLRLKAPRHLVRHETPGRVASEVVGAAGLEARRISSTYTSAMSSIRVREPGFVRPDPAPANRRRAGPVRAASRAHGREGRRLPRHARNRTAVGCRGAGSERATTRAKTIRVPAEPLRSARPSVPGTTWPAGASCPSPSRFPRRGEPPEGNALRGRRSRRPGRSSRCRERFPRSSPGGARERPEVARSPLRAGGDASREAAGPCGRPFRWP